MRISLNWLADYVDLPAEISPTKLAHDLTMTTVEVEKVEDLAESLDKVVVARILEVAPHPAGDHLRVVILEHGNMKSTVVCGASNVAVGMYVALALPGAHCLDKNNELFEIKKSQVRGIMSGGMICSSGELGIYDILPCKDGDVIDLSELCVLPGTPFANVIYFDDYVLEIDNKSLTNRPDLWCHYGFAREVAALYNLPLQQLSFFKNSVSDCGFTVEIVDQECCARYTATRISGVHVTQAPLWLRSSLVKVGQRPINLLVDLSNYVTFAIGQPSNVCDARLFPSRLEVRRATHGEMLALPDGTSLSLDAGYAVVSNHERPISLAGVISCKDTLFVDTESIWLEMATFDPVEIRRAVRRSGIRTQSSMRFDKGLDADRILPALSLFIELLTREQPSAKLVAYVDSFPRPFPQVFVEIDVAFLQRRLGRDLPEAQIRALLERLGFGVMGERLLTVRVPSWRATGDVSLPEDIVEEVARLFGYEELGFSPPIVALEAPVIQPRRRMERRIKELLAFRAGMREVVSYPWVSASLLDASGLSGVPTVGLAHAPSGDLQLAPSLVPQMLGIVASNLRYCNEFSIFELNRIFTPSLMASEEVSEHLPVQNRSLVAAFVGPDPARLFYQAKGVIESLGDAVQCEPVCFRQEVKAPWGDSAAQLGLISGEHFIGALAILSSRTKRKAGIRGAEVALFELDVDSLIPYSSRNNIYKPLPAYPETDFDFNLVVPHLVQWIDIQRIAAPVDPLVRAVSFIDEYSGEQVPEGYKSITIRLRLGSQDGTLVREQIDSAVNRVIGALQDSLQVGMCN